MSNPNKRKMPKSIFIILGIPILIILVVSIASSMMSQKSYDFSYIVNRFRNQEVVKYNMNLGSGDMDIYLKDGQVLKYNTPSVRLMLDSIEDHVKDYDKAHPNAPMVYNFIRGSETAWLFNIFTTVILPILVPFAILWFLMKKITVIGGDGGRSLPFGRAKAKKDTGVHSKIKFDSVAGVDEEKEELAEVVDFLKSPKKYSDLGARIPKGVLLVGPPGTGKTLLAKAVAGEADVPFYSMSGSDFVEMFVGVGASRVRDLFEQAKKSAPCVIFIDEIDAVGRNRGSARFSGGNEEREQTLNQLLVEMDGFEVNEGIIILAATNRNDILDPALVRPGRFDRSILIGYPDVQGREDILRIHAKGKPFDKDVKLKDIAKSTAGFTGADLESLLNESALLAARRNKKMISNKELADATLKVIMGTEKKSRVITEDEKKLTAYHESGHAIVTYFCKTQDPVHEISIIPRSHGAGGYTMSLPEKDHMCISKTNYEEQISTLLGGRIAEDLVLNDISTGASNDLARATKIARAMVVKYGMCPEIGPIVYESSSDDDSYFLQKKYSESVASKIDSEIKKIIQKSYDVAEKILKDNLSLLHKIANSLLEKETLSGDEFKSLIESAATV